MFETNKQIEKAEYEKTKVDFFDEMGKNKLYNVLYYFSIAYIIVKDSQNTKSDFSTMETFFKTNTIPDEIKSCINKKLYDKWDCIKQIKNNYSCIFFKQFLFSNDITNNNMFGFTTPNDITNLTKLILKPNSKDSVADLCSGYGAFLTDCAINTKSQYTGFEINEEMYYITKMKSDIFNLNINNILDDALNIDSQLKFDKIFCNPPFLIDTNNTQIENSDAMKFLNSNISNLSKRISSNWLFASAVINHLNKNGKGAIIVTQNFTFSLNEENIREFFVENGFIEAVISLPAKLFDYTAIPVILVVLSFNNNRITFVDASKEFISERRKNRLSNENLKHIIDALESKTSITKIVSKETIADSGYELNPSRWINVLPKIENGVRFETVIENISRGIQIKADEINSEITFHYTGLHYITLNDIQDGIVNDCLPNLKSIDSKYDKYCVTNEGTILLSKNGPNFKVAYIKSETNEKILVNGNMYIIHLKNNIINPIFLKTFLASKSGQAHLNNICVGYKLITLPIKSLKELIIPLPNIETQNKIAKKYYQKEYEIKNLKKQLERTTEELHNIYTDFIK